MPARQTSFRTAGSIANAVGTTAVIRRFQRQRESGLVPDAWQLSPRPASVPAWDRRTAEGLAGRTNGCLRGSGYKRRSRCRTDPGNSSQGRPGRQHAGAVSFGQRRGARWRCRADRRWIRLRTESSANNTWRQDGVPIRPGSGPDNMPGPRDTFAAYGLAWSNVSNTPLRDAKSTAYEGGIRTPLIACWPAVIRAGNRLANNIGHVIDLMPTCLDIADVAYPTDFHGRKPLPLAGKSLAAVFRCAACGRTRRPVLERSSEPGHPDGQMEARQRPPR